MLILAHGLRDSVHGQPTLLLWVVGEADYHGGRAWQREAAQLMAEAPGTKYNSQGHAASDLLPPAMPL